MDAPAPAPLRAPARLLAIAAGLGVTAQLLFFGERLGLNAPLFVGAFLLALFALGRAEGVAPAWRNAWLVPLLAAAAVFLAVRASLPLAVLNGGLVILLLGLVVRFFRTGSAAALTGRGYVLVPLLAWGHAAVRPVRLLAALRRPGTERKPLRAVVLPVLRGIVLALPVLVVLGFLLASADFVFEQLMKDLLNFRIPPPLARLAGRVAIAAGATWMSAGLLAFALHPATADDADLRRSSAPPLRLPYLETVSALVALDLLLALFVWVQFTYLFGGADAVAAEGYTYAEYARRGFLDLIVVSVVTFAIALFLGRMVRQETPRHAATLRWLVTILVVLTGVVLGSAFRRLGLYEEAFGYTRLRLYGHAFIVWTGVALAWLLVTRWRPAPRAGFGLGAFLCVVGFVLGLDVLNVDAFIARRNLDRLATTGRLDVRYLTRLSDDAVPTLTDALAAASSDPNAALLLRRDLAGRRARLAARAERTGWPSWHWGHRRATRMLSEQPER